MKKIYFACSIRGGRDDQPIYEELVAIIKAKAEVLSEIFGDKTLTEQGQTDLTDKQIWQRDTGWIKEADALIAEITNPSLGVGYEIAKAEEWGIPVLVFYRPQEGKRLSAMIAGSPEAELVEYQVPGEAKEQIYKFLDNLK